MEPEILTIFTKISWAGVCGLFIYFVLKPIFERVFNGGLYKRVNRIENNHLTEIKERLANVEKKIFKIEERIIEMEREIGYLKGKINQK